MMTCSSVPEDRIIAQRKWMISSFKKISRRSPTAILLSEHNTGQDMFITHLDKSPIILKMLVCPMQKIYVSNIDWSHPGVYLLFGLLYISLEPP
jgi:hypothetical protein